MQSSAEVPVPPILSYALQNLAASLIDILGIAALSSNILSLAPSAPAAQLSTFSRTKTGRLERTPPFSAFKKISTRNSGSPEKTECRSDSHQRSEAIAEAKPIETGPSSA